uniref:Zgc:113274 n=1 Tax=Acanthochromis polyacanthus TaxID=80966 RepID=A0A3Q1GJ06_9TELE
MLRKRSRKTNWGSTSLEEMQRAATKVQGGKSIRKVATERNIDRSTLRRFLKKKEGGEVTAAGYTGTANAKRVFTEEMEEDVANHVKKLADHFHGLTAKKSRTVDQIYRYGDIPRYYVTQTISIFPLLVSIFNEKNDLHFGHLVNTVRLSHVQMVWKSICVA